MLEKQDIYSHREAVGEISAAASGEHALEKTMVKVAGSWEGY